jgi:hypothetical protein
MNQGMVAFIDGKFINASAHTSYLYLVKERSYGRLSRPHPHEQNLRLNPFRFAAPVDSVSESDPGLCGPPIIY